MPKSSNQKLKLLYLLKILQEKTDENHPLTAKQLIEGLSMYGVKAERKSIYDDLEALRVYGLDIEALRSKTTGYYIANRSFELPELKLLVDSVQSSKFITMKKSMELIKKIENLCSVHDAQSLQRQVYVTNRIKTMNESIYYNVDKIHTGISENRKISFQYFEYAVTKEKIFKRDGQRYKISPYAMTWDDENYYMLGYDTEAGLLKHYRVDKMMDIVITNEKKDGQEHFKNFDIALYSKKLFGMFSGEEENVRIQFVNHLIGVVIDRFGKDIIVTRVDAGHFAINVNVAVSQQFLAWICSFGNDAKILTPVNVVEIMKNHLKLVAEQYSGS